MPAYATAGFSVSSLKEVLQDQLSVPANSTIALAFSGGLDSHVLLHALSRLAESYPFTLQAIHVNHSLQAESLDWVNHCQLVCDGLAIPLTVKTVVVPTEQGESLEAAARQVRYQALAEEMPDNGFCMTAQHMNDQSETLLLQLLRGAGVHGIASMPSARELANGNLLRPLLDFTREDLHDYALRHDLNWVEDPSNQDNRFDRNFLRNQVLPLLKERWPGMDKSLSRSARHAASAASMMDEMGQADLRHCLAGSNHFFFPAIASLRADCLRELSVAHQVNALRVWVRMNYLIVPGDDRLQSIIKLLNELPQKGAVVWQQGAFRLFKDMLWLCSSPDLFQAIDETLDWITDKPLNLPDQKQELHLIEIRGEGIAKAAVTETKLQVRFRQGGEVCKMPGEYGSKSLKKLLQDLSVPPWLRAGLPLIYLHDELIAVSSLWTNPHYLPATDEMGVIFSVHSG